MVSGRLYESPTAWPKISVLMTRVGIQCGTLAM